MSNTFFKFKQFTVHQDKSAMKVTTDACLFGAWATDDLKRIQPARILDIGTGTGLLSLMTAQACTTTKIDAVEIETGAAEQANENFKASPWADRISLQHKDVREAAYNKPFDAIICNPPFYENELASPDTKRNMAHHAGGLLLQDLLPLIGDHLATDGKAYLLLPAKRKAEIPAMLQKNGLQADHWVWVKQSPAHEPFRIMIRCGHDVEEVSNTPEETIIIEEASGMYTDTFAGLLKEYYLYL